MHTETQETREEYAERLKREEREERSRVRDVFSRVYNRHESAMFARGYNGDTHNAKILQRLRDMYDLALLLGGESERTFAHCLDRIDTFEAELHGDTSPFSLCWSGRGMYGGWIFHSSCREWSLHT